jgi:putative transposase
MHDFELTGHLFQGRFGSVAMDEIHLLAAFRYVAMNPVKAKMVDHASDWVWSSTKAHLSGKDDGLVSVRPLLDRVDNVSEFLAATPEQELEFALEKGQSIGRPLMEERALVELERKLARPIRPTKRCRPKRNGENSSQMKLV